MTHCLQKEKVGKKTVLERSSFDSVKHAEMLAFSDLWFPVYEQNHILTFPYVDRIVDLKI